MTYLLSRLPHDRPRDRRKHAARPSLDALEGRELLTTVAVIGVRIPILPFPTPPVAVSVPSGPPQYVFNALKAAPV